MKLLDKYIIRKYLSTFFFTALICSMIIVVIDVSQRVENFINEKLGLYDILFVYYLNFIPHINIILFPLYALISVIFFTSKLAYDSEIISILNAGVSFRRLMRPYMVSAGLICLLLLFFNHIADPWSSKKRVAFENTYFYKGNKDFDRASNIHFFLDSTSKVYVRYFREGENSISDFRLERFSDNKLVYMLKATRADWIEDSGKWKISDYKVFTFEGKKETFKSGLGMNFDTTLNMRPSDFIRFKNQKEMMTTAEIRTYIRSERDRGISNTKVFETEIHRRTADAFTLIILTLIGLTVASRKVRGGMGLHLAIGIGLGAAHIVLSKFAITFAQGNIIPPVIGVWIPNILFSLVALNLLRKAQK